MGKTISRKMHDMVDSNYTYPEEYTGPKPLLEQISLIEKEWDLDGSHAREFIKNLPAPREKGTKGLFAIPKLSAVAKKHFPEIKNEREQNCKAIHLVCIKLFRNQNVSQNIELIQKKFLRQNKRTGECISLLEKQQAGDILILEAQFGMRYRGYSVSGARYAVERGGENEFCLGTFHIGCMTLAHPERYTHSQELDTCCAGDELDPYLYNQFRSCLVFRIFDDGTFGITRNDSIERAYPQLAVVTGFVPPCNNTFTSAFL